MAGLVKTLRIGLFALVIVMPMAVQAYVECGVRPLRYYVGDEGTLWVVWTEGGAGIIGQSDPDFKPTLAAVMTALVTNRSMTVRYAAGSVCTAAPVAIVGIWQN